MVGILLMMVHFSVKIATWANNDSARPHPKESLLIVFGSLF